MLQAMQGLLLSGCIGQEESSACSAAVTVSCLFAMESADEVISLSAVGSSPQGSRSNLS